MCTRVNLNYRSKNSFDSYTQSSKATSTYHAVLYTWLLDTQTPWGLVLKQHDRDITHSTCSPDDVWPSRSAWYARAPTGREPGGRVGGRGSTLRVFSDKTDRSKIFFWRAEAVVGFRKRRLTGSLKANISPFVVCVGFDVKTSEHPGWNRTYVLIDKNGSSSVPLARSGKSFSMFVIDWSLGAPLPTERERWQPGDQRVQLCSEGLNCSYFGKYL